MIGPGEWCWGVAAVVGQVRGRSGRYGGGPSGRGGAACPSAAPPRSIIRDGPAARAGVAGGTGWEGTPRRCSPSVPPFGPPGRWPSPGGRLLRRRPTTSVASAWRPAIPVSMDDSASRASQSATGRRRASTSQDPRWRPGDDACLVAARPVRVCGEIVPGAAPPAVSTRFGQSARIVPMEWSARPAGSRQPGSGER